MRARRSSTLEPPALRSTKSFQSIATTAHSGYRSAKSSLSPSEYEPSRDQSFVSALDHGQGSDEEEDLGYYDHGEDDHEGEEGDELAYLQSNNSYLSSPDDDISEPPTPQQPQYHHSPSLSSSLNEGGSSSSTEGESIISSSESTTFQLSSPFPRQQILKPTPSNPLLTGKKSADKENVPEGETKHVRVRANPEQKGFPYVGSVIMAAAPSSSTWIDPEYTERSSTSMDTGRPSQDTVMPSSSPQLQPQSRSQRSSSEVELDLSFDLPLSPPSAHLPPAQTRRRSLSSLSHSSSSGSPQRHEDWVGIDMSAPSTSTSPSHNGVGELMRSPSGRLTGTRKRIRSAFELREAYLQGEREMESQGRAGANNPMAFAILMDEDGDSRQWITKKASANRLSAADSLGTGFSFNTTKALAMEVPLPESPLPSTTWERKPLPLPLRIISPHTAQSEVTSPSPAWSISSFFKNRDAKDTPPTSHFDDHSPPPTTGESVRPGWVDEFAKNTLRYLGMKRREQGRTEQPLLVGQVEAYAREEEEERGEELHGLGFDFGQSHDQEEDLTRSTKTTIRPTARTHATIPSLSISPPIGNEEEHDADAEDGDSTSGDSAVDPTVSPSRRLSRSLSPTSLRSTTTQLDRRTSVTFPPTLSKPIRPNFGAPPRNLLYSETMPGARLPHQTSLDSTRFSFVPAPLSLVQEHLQSATTPLVDNRKKNRRRSISSLTDIVFQYPSSLYIDEVVPARILFSLGFLLGPWCWILGGWWLRSLDGELHSCRGSRCRRDINHYCGCGNMIGWVNRASKRRHGNFEKEMEGMDEWVKANRIAAEVSGVIIVGAMGVAIWAVASA